MNAFINGIGAITPMGCFPSENFLKELHVSGPGRMTVVEPKYSDYIGVMQLRRMSKIIKMGLTSALMCLNDANIKKPNAIITATGLGSVQDTDRFLDNLIDNQENALNPTPFIHSTHNAVAARIAIETGCHDYNMTYVHKNAAFEQAMLDAILKINSGLYTNVLLGGVEEITEENYNLKKHVGFWKEGVNNLELAKNTYTPGTIAGEGSVFFNLSSDKSANSYAEIKDTKTWYKLPAKKTLALETFLSSVHLTPGDIDLVLSGTNGNVGEDYIYHGVFAKAFTEPAIAWYKHLCGEYDTSVSFALLLAAYLLKTQSIPEFIKFNGAPSKKLKNVLIYQQRFNRNHSFTVLSKC